MTLRTEEEIHKSNVYNTLIETDRKRPFIHINLSYDNVNICTNAKRYRPFRQHSGRTNTVHPEHWRNCISAER